MPAAPKPLDIHQQELINALRATHTNLALARKLRNNELSRRTMEKKIILERAIDELEERIKAELDAEIAAHEVALDDALIAAYNANIPIRQIATKGFGNRYEGGVHQLLTKLRLDGAVGTRTEYQRNGFERTAVTEFPRPIEIDDYLTESLTVAEPLFTPLAEDLELVSPSTPGGDDGVYIPAVLLTMDSRDPYFAVIEKNARKGTSFLRATTATLYIHPATKELTVHESREVGTDTWDHPVARWVKDHPEEARAGYDAATA